MNITQTYIPQEVHYNANASTSFDTKYKLVQEIGNGTYSNVFLAHNPQGEIVAVKRYQITDPNVIDLCKQEGMSIAAHVRKLAEQELLISQITDHPNIVKVREVFIENLIAYVVMDYVPGKTLDLSEKGPLRHCLNLIVQLLEAIKHLLMRNIIIDDLWSGNILVSEDSHLTLIDLGSLEMMDDDPDRPVKERVEMVENMVTAMSPEAARVLDKCKGLIPEDIRNENISPSHVKPLVHWINALQQELSPQKNTTQTFHVTSADETLSLYDELQTKYPNHISFCTAQNSEFLAYSIIAGNVLEKFRPGNYLQNVHVLRYPFAHLPKSLSELFQALPVKEHYDTASSLVGDALISASPSLKEDESQESAWAIFKDNERASDDTSNVADYVSHIFETEHVDPIHFRDRIKSLLEDAPRSKTGLLYSFFIPKEDPLHKAVYISQPYGIPLGDPLSPQTLSDFYTKYSQGSTEDQNLQLRFLPSALTHENKFHLDQITSYRFTTISPDELDAFTQKVKRVVDTIFTDHHQDMIQLSALAASVETLTDQAQKQEAYQTLCYKYLCKRDVQLATHYWYKLGEQNPHKPLYLPGIIACLLTQRKLPQAYHYFQKYEETLIYKEQIVARFALMAIEQENQPMLDKMLSKLSDPNLRKFILSPECEQDDESDEPTDLLLSDDDLIKLSDTGRARAKL